MGYVKLETTTYNIDELEKRYYNFLSPAFEVIIDGTNILRESIAVSSVTVETTVSPMADSFSFTVTNAFDLIKREFKWLDSYFAVGKYVEIKTGYTDRLKTIFYGVITSVSFEYPINEIPTIKVSGMDISFLMMKGKHSGSWIDKKHSDVVKEIGRKYGAKLEVDDTHEKKPIIEQIGTNDFLFIAGLAAANNYEFFVVGNTIYFRRPRVNTNPVFTLTFGKNMLSYSVEIDIADQVSEVVVRGVDIQNTQSIEAKASKVDILGSNSRTGADIMKSLSNHSKEYVYANVNSVAEANALATSLLNKKSMELVKGRGSCIGVPEIRAGRYIKLDGLGKKMNQLMYLTSVVHQIDDQGYITSFEVGGNAI